MAEQKPVVGIVGQGLYLPQPRMTAADIAAATGGVWTEAAIRDKLGVVEKPVPGPEDGTQDMAVKAALDCLQRTGCDPTDIDLILCVGEEWKEYPLTTSGIYVQERIGAHRAWSIDLQQRCNSTVAALKIAHDMLIADPELRTAMIVGGYRNGDFLDYRDPAVSFMYNLGAGAGAFLVRRDHPSNHLLGFHIMTDGSMARDVGVRYGGCSQPLETLDEATWQQLRQGGNRSLTLFDAEHMKNRLNEVSMGNWMTCLDRALLRAGLDRSGIDFLNVLHFKPSMYRQLLADLGLREDQSLYLPEYGHIGQVDQMLITHEALQRGRLRDGMVMAILAAGIGYVWGAAVVRWGAAG